jgi:polysaccharide chain length determinant protein (PEP-CTERM system associated)
MTEIYEQLLYWINTIWRRRWPALAVAWFVCVAGWFLVVSKPDTYTSTTSIFIDTQSILKPLLKGLAVDRDLAAEVGVMNQTITNRQNMERVARMTDLDLTVTTQAEMEGLVNSLRARTQVETEGYLVSISFTDIDRERARDVVEAIATVFIEQNLGENREEIEGARVFLDKQIAEYDQQLAEAEKRLADFRRDKLSALPDRQTYQFRLEELRGELQAAEASLQRALSRRKTLEQQIAAGPASDTALEIFKIEEEIKELLTKFTAQHPDVAALERRLDELKQKHAQETLAAGGGDSAASGSGFSAARLAGADYSQLKSLLAEEEANVAIYSDQVQRLRSKVSRLENQAAQVPIVEADLARLNRDYDVIKEKHSQLVSRREQAIISEKKEVGSDRIKFQIVDPARVPSHPNGPPRSMLLTAVLFFGLGAGAAFAAFLSIVNETFNDPQRLRQAFNFPVLGVVAPVRTASEQALTIANHMSFVTVLGVLIAGYAILFTSISYLKTLRFEALPGFDELFLRFSTLLGG